jgi:hypothetical protein
MPYQPLFFLCLNLMDSFCIVHKFIQGPNFKRYDIVRNNILFAENGVEVFDKFHCNYLVCELIVNFVKKFRKLKVKHKRTSIFSLNVEAILDVNVDQFTQRMPQAEYKPFEMGW